MSPRWYRLLSVHFFGSPYWATAIVLIASTPASGVVINEIRIDSQLVDPENAHEYVELFGTPGESLDGLTYLVIGDVPGGASGPGRSGAIEEVTSLSGQQIGPCGYFVVAESTFSLGSRDLTTALNFENLDNVTHMLVSGFTGVDDQDLDTNNDGTLDLLPWTMVVDRIAVIRQNNPPTTTEYHYGPPTVGPAGLQAPSHVFRCPDGTGAWFVGQASTTARDDTPGSANACAACCTSGVCADRRTAAQCSLGGGLYQGDGTTCAMVTCTSGACCLAGECVDAISSASCVADGGTYQGNGSVCASVACATPPSVIISEIMYNPDSTEGIPNQVEWVEIYNTGTVAVDISGWRLQNENGMTGGLPGGTSIAARQAVVLIPADQSVAEFQAAWGSGYPVFGLSGWNTPGMGALTNDPSEVMPFAGRLSLRNASGVTTDLVNYDDDQPMGTAWPADFPSDGPSIHVKCTTLDAIANDDGGNWSASFGGIDGVVLNTVTGDYNGMDRGSPGTVNCAGTLVCPPCNADLSGDGQVTPSDAETLILCLQGLYPEAGQEACDINCDGVVDLFDLETLGRRINLLSASCAVPMTTGACCWGEAGQLCDRASSAACMFLDGTYLGDGSTCLGGPCDCNNNGTADGVDIGSMFSEDCNANSLPDECDVNGSGSLTVNTAIPDAGAPMTDVYMHPTSGQTIEDVNVVLDISHVAVGDLIITLNHGATTVNLFNHSCTTTDNLMGTTFDDQASGPIACADLNHTGTYTPDQPLSQFAGMASFGNWTLSVTDTLATNTGTFNGWSLRIRTLGTPNRSQDCNNNGLPDECERAACLADPNCDDCNLNGVLDSCDLAGGTSMDMIDLMGLAGADLVPDECVFWVGDMSCSGQTWFCAANWQPPVIPNNGMDTYSVTIDDPMAVVTLDGHATVDTLRLLDGATLKLTSTGCGDLDVVGTGGVLAEGIIQVSGDHTLTIPNGDLEIGPKGRYEPDPGATGVTATLVVRNITVQEDPDTPGELNVKQAMNVQTTGNVKMAGTNASPGGVATGCRPPVLNTTGTALLQVMGNFTMQGAVDMRSRTPAASGGPNAAGADNPRIEIAGDVFNHMIYPEIVDWGELSFELNGTNLADIQILEAGGVDLGATAAGFVDNFAAETIEAADGSSVWIHDTFANDDMPGGPAESIYIGTFAVGAGASVTIDAVTEFHTTLIDPDLGIVTMNGGASMMAPAPTGACCTPAGSCTVVTELSCKGSSGAYQGDGTVCTPNPCPIPSGACCQLSMGAPTCTVLTAAECASAGGTYRGDDTNCVTTLCTPSINEIDWDQPGTDGLEYLELFGPGGMDLTGWSVVLYNGSGGAAYGSPIALSSIPADGYLVIGSATVPNVDIVAFTTDGIQNGSPDGMALCNGATAVQLLSYEGSFTASGATTGCGAGMLLPGIGELDFGVGTQSVSLCPNAAAPRFQRSTTLTPGTPNSCSPPPVNDDCSGALPALCGTTLGDNSGSVLGDQVEASCQTNSNKDLWYTFTSPVTSTILVNTEGSVQTDTVLTVYSACGGMVLACDDDSGTGLLSSLTFSATMGTSYRIRVATFGSAAAGGAFNLNISCPVCGDGIVAAPETCDDGGLADCDGCDSNCTLTACGNGIVCAGEACDEGGDAPSCDADCTKVICGDGTLNLAAGEECDDGNTTPGDGCSPLCQDDFGACCTVPGNVCTDGLTPVACEARGGLHQGGSSTCLTTNCADIPTVSQWGLIVMSLLLISAGTIVFGRRKVFARPI